MAEVYDITCAAMEDLAGSLLSGFCLPNVGDYLIVEAISWLGTVLEPELRCVCTDIDDALYSLQELEEVSTISMQLGSSVVDQFELWHVVC